MTWKMRFIAMGLAAGATLQAAPAIAADHRDAPGTIASPENDVNDVYAWMSPDGTRVRLGMTVFPAATAASRFSNASDYVFHTASRANFAAMAATPLDIIARFDATGNLSLWVGTTFLYVPAASVGNTAGTASADGRIRVYAGLRKDHFYFNLEGFNLTRNIVRTAAQANMLGTPDAAGCFPITAAQQTAISNQLRQGMNGAAPTDFFRNLNTLAIVLEIDRTLLNGGGNIFSVWGATHRRAN